MSTATDTATGKPRPGRASRPAGRAWPPPPRPPRSASAAPSPPDPRPPPLHPPASTAEPAGRGTGRRPKRHPGHRHALTVRDQPGSAGASTTPATNHIELHGIAYDLDEVFGTHSTWDRKSSPPARETESSPKLMVPA